MLVEARMKLYDTWWIFAILSIALEYAFKDAKFTKPLNLSS